MSYVDFLKKGDLSLENGRCKESLEFYSEAIKLDKNSDIAYNKRGRSYYLLKEYGKAIMDIERALEIDPKYVKAYLNRGDCYLELGKLEEALEDYSKAHEINPNYEETSIKKNAVMMLINNKKSSQNNPVVAQKEIQIKLDEVKINSCINENNAFFDLEGYIEFLQKRIQLSENEIIDLPIGERLQLNSLSENENYYVFNFNKKLLNELNKKLGSDFKIKINNKFYNSSLSEVDETSNSITLSVEDYKSDYITGGKIIIDLNFITKIQKENLERLNNDPALKKKYEYIFHGVNYDTSVNWYPEIDEFSSLNKNDLNQYQKAAILYSIFTNKAFLIHGPPGTGKSTTIVEMVNTLLSKNLSKRILVCSYTNKAVISALEKIVLLGIDITTFNLPSYGSKLKDNSLKSKTEAKYKELMKEYEPLLNELNEKIKEKQTNAKKKVKERLDIESELKKNEGALEEKLKESDYLKKDLTKFHILLTKYNLSYNNSNPVLDYPDVIKEKLSKINEKEKAISNHEKEIKEITSVLNNKYLEMSTLQDTIKNITNEIANTKTQEKELEALIQQNIEYKKELEKIKEIKSRLVDLSKEKKILEVIKKMPIDFQDIARLNSIERLNANELTAFILKLEGKLDSYNKELEKNKSHLVDRILIKKSYEDKLKSLEKEKNAKEKIINEKHSEINKLNEKINLEKTNLNALSDELYQKINNYFKVAEKLIGLDNLSVKKDLFYNNSELGVFNEKINKIRIGIKKSIKSTSDKIGILEKKLDEKEIGISNLKGEQDSKKAAMLEISSTIGAIEKEISEINAEISNINSKFNKNEISKEILLNSKVIGTTNLRLANKVFKEMKFEHCIMDEGGFIDLVGAIIPIIFSDKLIILGDPNQLRPIVYGGKNKQIIEIIEAHPEYKNSIFEILENNGVSNILLEKQYRMIKQISEFVSEMFYKNRIECCHNGKNRLRETENKITSSKYPLIFIPTYPGRSGNEGYSLYDYQHLDIINKILSQYEVEYGKKILEDIGIITPYRAQVQKLEENIDYDLNCGTVHTFQGRENSVIIYSIPKHGKSYSDGSHGHLLSGSESINLLNVAVSRAKEKLIILGNKEILSEIPHYKKLLNHIYQNDGIYCGFENVEKYKSTCTICGNSIAKNVPHCDTCKIINFKRVYPNKIITKDGHSVKSNDEARIDDFFYENGISHEYERLVPISETVMWCDWVLRASKNNLERDLYIEYLGMLDNEDYVKRSEWKKRLYNKYKISLLEIKPEHTENLEDVLKRKLREYGLKI